MPVLFLLQAGGQLAIAMVQLGDLDGASRVAIELADTADAAEQAWGVGAAPAVAVLRLAEGRLAMARDPNAGLAALQRAVDLAESWGRATVLVASLTSLAAAQWGTGDRAGARLSIDRAREAAEDEQARPLTLHQLDELQARIGRRASKAARTNGELLEELTDRELAVLRALRGPLSAREIATEMYLSMNTVKSYTKSLYRKLGVVTRAEAVRRAHEVGLI
jgi:LuxR family maltose regulon positive regulatory protein